MNSSETHRASSIDEATHDLLVRSGLFRERFAEHEEILRHKWLESEKAGYDIGYGRALVSWAMHHRSAWRKAWRSRVKP